MSRTGTKSPAERTTRKAQEDSRVEFPKVRLVESGSQSARLRVRGSVRWVDSRER